MTVRIEPDETPPIAPTLYQLRGIAKKAFQELGGGEAFLQLERDQFLDANGEEPEERD